MMPAEFRTSVIYHCTACGQPIREISGSGNNHGMRVWSDGKEECEMHFEQHWLVLCPHCRAPLWMDELEGYEELDDDDGYDDEDDDGTGDSAGLPEGWRDLEYIELPAISPQLMVGEDGVVAALNEALDYDIPAFADYLAVLPTIRRFPEKVFEMRLRAWWAGNDRRRGQADTLPLAPEEADNLLALLPLFGASPYEQLLKAEALRELGRFAEAGLVLAAINDPDMARAVTLLQERVAQQDARVVVLVG